MIEEDMQARRLLAFIFQTRTERALGWVASLSYRISVHGAPGWVGDRADDLRSRAVERRLQRQIKREEGRT